MLLKWRTHNNKDAVGWVKEAWAVIAETSTPAWRLRKLRTDSLCRDVRDEWVLA